jgi:hypothetical protein
MTSIKQLVLCYIKFLHFRLPENYLEGFDRPFDP